MDQAIHNKEFVNSVLNFISKTLTVEQCLLQIYIKQTMKSSKLHSKFCSSLFFCIPLLNSALNFIINCQVM